MQKEIPEELQIDILRRLPIAGCIIRFRCVCKLWCALMSNPSFTRQKLFLADDGDEISDSSPVTMLINHSFLGMELIRSVYSLHSCNTLQSLLEADLPFSLDKYHIAGCCNGLVCICQAYGPNIIKHSQPAANTILWNPATSETKILPPILFNRPGEDTFIHTVGFGFDPETNDYKVVRQINYKKVGWRKKNDHFVEVYSLRNDLWKRQ